MPSPLATPDAEPRPQAGQICFSEGDFRALSEPLCRDKQFDDARLATRRKLLALGKRFSKAQGTDGLKLDCRTSLHHPRVFNGMRVRRLWSYLMRPKPEKTRLRKTIGADLAKDLNAAYRNAYLCLAIEGDMLEVSYRIHADAWFDGQNLLRRIKAEGLKSWLDVLNSFDGYRLRMHDWAGEWNCGQLEIEQLVEYLSYYKPGEHSLAVERRWPAPAGARQHAFGAEVPELMLQELERLVPLYRFATWSQESDFLFAD